MEPFWWQLPGPARYLDLLEQDLRQGKNLLLALPEHFPSVRRAVADRVRGGDAWSWRELDLGAVENAWEDPSLLLHSCFAPQPVGTLLSARSLAASDGFSGTIVWVEGMTARTWPAWRSFLEDYEQACRSRSEFDRSMFCVPMAGALAEELPSQIALQVRPWRGCLSRLDMTLYLAHLVRDRRLSALERGVVVTVGAELAAFDPTLAQTLAQTDLRGLLDPFQILADVATKRSWPAVSEGELGWRSGVVDEMDGISVAHSALLARNDRRGEVLRRIWRGQVAVIFPFIEEQRVRLLPQLKCHLQVPYRTQFGEVTDVYDMEIGHIVKQVARAHIPTEVNQLLICLRDMRHALAHLEPVGADRLIASEALCDRVLCDTFLGLSNCPEMGYN